MPEITQLIFTYFHKVRFSEVDAGQALYHPRYLEIFDGARENMFEELDHPVNKMLKNGEALSVVDLQIKYRKPCFLADPLVVETQVTELRPKVLILNQRIFRPAQEHDPIEPSRTLCTEAKITLIHVSLAEMKSCAMPKSLFDALHLTLTGTRSI
jgi:YbgC/YbaW family acyl-CoA thioester hydrolase